MMFKCGYCHAERVFVDRNALEACTCGNFTWSGHESIGITPRSKVPRFIGKIIEATAPKRLKHSDPTLDAVMVDVECLARRSNVSHFGPIDVMRAFTSLPVHVLETLSAEDIPHGLLQGMLVKLHITDDDTEDDRVVTGSMRRIANACATVKRKELEAGIVARTKDGTPLHGTPGMFKAAVEKRIAEYAAMGFIDARGMIPVGERPEIHDVGRAMKSDDQVDALVRAFNHEYSEPPMNEKIARNSAYGQTRQDLRNIEEEIEVASRDRLFEIARTTFGVLLRSNETDEESRVRLRKAIAHRRESEARMPTKIDAANMQCTIACAQCGHANVYPLGETDPKESTCTHRFRFAPEKGRMGALICCVCPLTIPREDLERLNIDPAKRYSREGNALADEMTVLSRENRDVMAENARLRMRVESLERKAKARR